MKRTEINFFGEELDDTFGSKFGDEFYDRKNYAFTRKNYRNYDGFSEAGPYLISYTGTESHVVIREGITVIGNTAFAKNHSICSIHLPESLKVIEWEAFRECKNLKAINFPKVLEIIEEGAFKGCESIITDVELSNVKVIGKNAFMGCTGICNVKISGQIQEPGEGIFLGCEGLLNASMPDNLTDLPNRMFFDCSSLLDVTLSAKTAHIGDFCFGNCYSLGGIDIPENTTFGAGAFNDCGNMVNEYGMLIMNGTFLHCSWALDSVNIPDTVSVLDAGAFDRCVGLDSLVIPDSVKEITGYHGKIYTGFARLTVGGIVSRYPFLFADNDLEEIVLSGQTAGIAAGVFSGNEIEEIIIPAGVKFIGSSAFGSCSSLRKVVFKGNAPEIDEDAFEEVEAVMYYPKENHTWVPEVFANYGGTLTWTAYEITRSNP